MIQIRLFETSNNEGLAIAYRSRVLTCEGFKAVSQQIIPHILAEWSIVELGRIRRAPPRFTLALRVSRATQPIVYGDYQNLPLYAFTAEAWTTNIPSDLILEMGAKAIKELCK